MSDSSLPVDGQQPTPAPQEPQPQSGAQTPPGAAPPATTDPDASDLTKRLEKICEELKVRDDDESARQRTADSKLTSALAVIPIVIALSTSSFVPLLALSARLGCVGVGIVIAFFLAILLFVFAAGKAIYGLWPMSAQYQAIGLRTVSRFANEGTYEELLRKIIAERSDLVRANKVINGRKLGDYADAALLTVVGLGVLTAIVLTLVVVFAINPHSVVDNPPTTAASASPSPRASPLPTP